jgi:hypothetical protein
VEAPGRVTVGAWPDAKLQARDARAQGNLTRWDVPLLSLKEQGDSAVTLYWPEAELKPGARREVRFTYGLGSLAADEGEGRLALAVGGSFTPGGELTLVAFVKDPTAGETLTLEGPPDWQLVGGAAAAPVPAPPAGASPAVTLVAWKVRPPPGAATSGRLRVRSSTGLLQSRTVATQAEPAGL